MVRRLSRDGIACTRCRGCGAMTRDELRAAVARRLCAQERNAASVPPTLAELADYVAKRWRFGARCGMRVGDGA